jgi:zinc carboxypeptidase
MLSRQIRPLALLVTLVTVTAAPVAGQGKITSPKEQFGFDIGADYVLPNYTQFVAYWEKLARESDRMVLDTIGTTAEGRPQLMAIITSPANHAKLERYREISRRLAFAEGLSDDDAHALAREGKAVVWIDGGLHATEVLGAEQLIETVWQLVSMNDAETMRFLDDIVILAVHANPDGMELVSNWYMREKEPTKRSTNGIPRLYHKYVGHDNNRDFYASTQPETENMNRVMYREWFPQIVYNHHQTGPEGTVMFAPPFRDPFNYNFDPLVPMELDLVGAAMHSRFEAEGKPGVTMRSGANYSTWWNGGLRTMPYFHNMIGLLTETIGNPTPVEIPFVPQLQLPRGDYPFPIAPQTWHFRQSVDYSVTANRAVLDLASRYREEFLFNIYRMGKNSIARGSRDNWTPRPKRVEALQASITADGGTSGGRRGAAIAPTKYFEALRLPADRDARGYIIPADQPDFPTATKFVEALLETGIAVERATRDFEVGGKRYRAGSYVVQSAQAFRPHVLDMFEPQDHPHDFAYPGGPPKAPYDNAGWTLAYQMGVQFDRILDGFDGPFEEIQGTDVRPPAGTVAASRGGWLLSHKANDAFTAINRLLKNKQEVYWLQNAVTANGKSYSAGTLYIPSKGSTLPLLQRMATELGLTFDAVGRKPAGAMMALRPVRIGLWDRYGGSMPSGWTRWLFEQYEFPYEVVYAPQLDAGNLASKYDVLIFVDDAIPERDGITRDFFDPAPSAAEVPAEFRSRLGEITVATTVPQLRRFVESGGTLIAIGGSTSIARHLGLPVGNALVEKGSDGTEKPLPRERFYVPGSLLRVSVDTTAPLAAGIGAGGNVDVFFDNSPAFTLASDAAARGVRPIAWFANATPLRSGWAWGERYLDGGVEVAEASLGKGKVFLFAPEITFRGQPYGTFKFLFNGIYYGEAATR